MNSKKTIILISAFTFLFIGGGIYAWSKNQVVEPVPEIKEQIIVDSPVATPTPTANKEVVKEEKVVVEPFTYLESDVPATVTKNTTAFDYTASQLESMAEYCQTAQDENYFTKLVAKFKGTEKTVYSFKYQGNSQDNDTFTITLLPNKAGYSSLDRFKMDFNVCEAGGDAYPSMLNKNWLLFESSCDSGFDDGSGKVHGCNEIKNKIKTSLKLN